MPLQQSYYQQQGQPFGSNTGSASANYNPFALSAYNSGSRSASPSRVPQTGTNTRMTSTGIPQFGGGGQQQFYNPPQIYQQPQTQQGYKSAYDVYGRRGIDSGVRGSGMPMTLDRGQKSTYQGPNYVDPMLFGDPNRAGPKMSGFQKAFYEAKARGILNDQQVGSINALGSDPNTSLARYAAIVGVPIEQASAHLYGAINKNMPGMMYNAGTNSYVPDPTAKQGYDPYNQNYVAPSRAQRYSNYQAAQGALRAYGQSGNPYGDFNTGAPSFY